MTTHETTPDPSPTTHAQQAPAVAPHPPTHREPTFTLRAQDVTADLVVDFWTMVQLRVRHQIKEGTPVAVAVQNVRRHFGIPDYPPILGIEKLDGAAKIAEAMCQWPTRKLAD